jgi:hypothetical protein
VAERFVVIEHKDGRRYAVAPADFRRLYEPEGFEALHYEDGEPYEAPKRNAPRSGKDG